MWLGWTVLSWHLAMSMKMPRRRQRTPRIILRQIIRYNQSSSRSSSADSKLRKDSRSDLAIIFPSLANPATANHWNAGPLWQKYPYKASTTTMTKSRGKIQILRGGPQKPQDMTKCKPIWIRNSNWMKRAALKRSWAKSTICSRIVPLQNHAARVSQASRTSWRHRLWVRLLVSSRPWRAVRSTFLTSKEKSLSVSIRWRAVQTSRLLPLRIYKTRLLTRMTTFSTCSVSERTRTKKTHIWCDTRLWHPVQDSTNLNNLFSRTLSAKQFHKPL